LSGFAAERFLILRNKYFDKEKRLWKK